MPLKSQTVREIPKRLSLRSEDAEKYVRAVAWLISGTAEMSQHRVRRLFQLCAVLRLDPDQRRRVLDTIWLQRTPTSWSRPAFADPRARLSLAKDALGVAGRGPSEIVQERLLRLLKYLRIRDDQVEMLRWWTFWEWEVYGAIERGSVIIRATTTSLLVQIFGNEFSYLAHMLNAAAMVGIPPQALYLTATQVGFAAANALENFDDREPVRILVALGASAIGAKAAIEAIGSRFLSELTRDAFRKVSSKRAQLRMAVQEMTETRARYLRLLDEDRATLVERPEWKQLTAALRRIQARYFLLARLTEQERAKVRRLLPGKDDKKAVELYRTPTDVISCVVKFANENLKTEGTEEAWVERLLLLSTYTRRTDIRDLNELQREVRDILSRLSAGDRWAFSDPQFENYGRIARYPKWKLPGLEEFEFEPTWSISWRPLSVDFRWYVKDPWFGEEIFAEDLRSGVLVRFREAIRSFVSKKGRLVRRIVAKCPVCGKFLRPSGKRFYCLEGLCGRRANDIVNRRVLASF